MPSRGSGATNPRGAQIISVASSKEADAFRRLAAPGPARPLEGVIKDAERIFARRVQMDHPRFYALIPSPASSLSSLGKMLTSSFNPHAGGWMQSFKPNAIEQGLIEWLAQWVDLPPDAGGLFVPEDLWQT